MSFSRIGGHHSLLVCSVAFLTATLIGFPSRAFGQRPIKTTLCAILSDPQRFHRVLVQFQAQWDVGFENSILVNDADCQMGIAPRFPRIFEGEKQLEKACRGIPGTVGKVNNATWVGVFRYHADSVPAWTLDVRKMSELSFTCEYTFRHPQSAYRSPRPPLGLRANRYSGSGRITRNTEIARTRSYWGIGNLRPDEFRAGAEGLVPLELSS
jgi:hypothetical protein